MPLLSIVFGIILIPIGLVVFQTSLEQTGVKHYTALIPVVLGGLLVLLGGLSYIQGVRKHAMHTAAMVALIGALGAGPRAIPDLVVYLRGGEVASLPKLVGTSLTTLICLIFVGLCINSFIQARRRREAAQGETR